MYILDYIKYMKQRLESRQSKIVKIRNLLDFSTSRDERLPYKEEARIPPFPHSPFPILNSEFVDLRSYSVEIPMDCRAFPNFKFFTAW